MQFTLSLGVMLSVSLSFTTVAEEGPPGTDIFIAPIHLAKQATQKKHHNNDKHKKNYSLGKAKAITTRKGYDNQPFFLPDGSGLLYTAISLGQENKWQADSFLYRFVDQQHVNLTHSELSEYSPTLMADGQHFSAIVVEADGRQFLWKLPVLSSTSAGAKVNDQAQAAGRLFDLDPIGYHAWGAKQDLVMFVLASKEDQPHTLQYKASISSPAKVVASDIGRSLRYVPSRNSFSFSWQKASPQQPFWWLAEYFPAEDRLQSLVPLPEGADYYTWLDDHTAIASVGTSIMQWHYRQDGSSLQVQWQLLADLSAQCKTKVSRLAVNRQRDQLAFVCDE